MWVLVSQTDAGKRHRLLSGHEYMIGRKDCDIIIENDMSISRKHAAVQVSHPDSNVLNPLKLPSLTFEDKSRLGTLVGNERVTKAKCLLNNGSVLVFGTAGISKYRAIYEPFITTTSCLDATGKKMSRQLIGRLGGHVISEWRKECELLIMNTLSITIKAICALIAQRPIITPQYLMDLAKSIENQTKAPHPDNYLPPLVESQLDPSQVSFKANPQRKSVFKGKVFIFLTAKQFKKLSVAVELAGGTPMLLEEGTDDNKDDILVSAGSCVMSCDPFDQSQKLSTNAQNWIQHVLDLLKRHDKRPLQECEIGYAVLYCSVETHCNPDITPGIQTPVPVAGQTLSQIDLSTSQLQAPSSQHSFRRNSAAVGPPRTPAKTEVSLMTAEVSSLNAGFDSMPPARKKWELDEETVESPAKRSATESSEVRGAVRQIKEEPITPVKNDDCNRGRLGRKRHSPSPVPDKTLPKGRARDVPNVVTLETKSLPNPSESSSSSVCVKQEVRGHGSKRRYSEEDRAGSDGEEFNPFSSVRSRKSCKVERKPEAVKQPERGHGSKRRYSDSEEDRAGSDGEEVNLFSSVRTRKNRKVEKEPEVMKRPISSDEENLFSSVPTRRKRNGQGRQTREESSPGPSSPSPQRGGRRQASPSSPSPQRGRRAQTSPSSPSPQRGGRKQTSPSSPSPQRGRRAQTSPSSPSRQRGGRKQTSPSSPSPQRARSRQASPSSPSPQRQKAVKQELQRDMDDDVHVSEIDNAVRQRNRGIATLVSGFLTTDRPTTEQAPLDEDFEFRSDLPTDVLQVEERPLVVRRPGYSKGRDQSNDESRWQGKIIKNFKKFKKVPLPGGGPVLNVIGGNDFITHENKQMQARDDLFNEYLENESRQSQSQREADDLFGFQTRGKSRNKTGRRK